MNEPWAGDIYGNPLLLLPGYAGYSNLMHFYDRTHATIRRYDQEALIFYEPVTWGVLWGGNYFGSGFTHVPGNDRSRTVFTWHYYCWLLQFNGNPLVNGTIPKFDRVLCDNIQLEVSFESVFIDLFKLGAGPSFLSEFGVCSFSDPTRPGVLNTDECEAILDANDRYMQSWTYWDSCFYRNEACDINEQLLDVFSRVYPIATNGVPRSMYFNMTTKEFIYLFDWNVTSVAQAQLPTEIFVPDHVYSLGFQVKVGMHYIWYFDEERSVVVINLAEEILAKMIVSNGTFEFFNHCKVWIHPSST